jgi:hypothetical protein
LPFIYKILDEMLAANMMNQAIEACFKIATAFPDESKCWFIHSQAFQNLNQPEAALRAIEVAILKEPMNPDYTFQLFNVFIQMGRYGAIPLRINRLWQHYDTNMKDALAAYLEIALDTGIISKLELSVEVASDLAQPDSD